MEYSEDMVNRKLFRQREDTPGRIGDAVIMSLENAETSPYLVIDDRFPCLGSLYLYFTNVLSRVVGEEVPNNTKLLVNYQTYKESSNNSLPFHFDAEIFKGEWNKEYIKLKEGLIPRLVMVMVLENENDGKGLQIMKPNGEIIKLDLYPGDILFFDNTKVLHGVPESLPNRRSMIGMRSFETSPLYFKESGLIDGSNIIAIDTPYVKGQATPLTTEEAKEILKNEGWYY